MGIGEEAWRSTRGERNPMATLTEADVCYIRSLAAAGKKQADIAGELGVAQSTVSKILHGGRWGHVKR